MEKLDEDDDIFLEIDGVYYTKDLKILVECPSTKTGEVRIPEGVEIIKSQAFQFSEIESVVMPDSLKNIQQYAFQDCPYLRHVDFGHGITEIGRESQINMLFYGCPNLKTVEVPPQVRTIHNHALSFVCLDELILHEGLESIRDTALACCGIRELELPASLKYFGSGNSEQIKTFHLKTIPQTFILKIVRDEYDWLSDEKSDSTVFTICLNGKQIFVPSMMGMSTKIKVNALFNDGIMRDAVANNMFQYAMTENGKLETAFRIYCEAKRNGQRLKNIETMLKPHAYSMTLNYLSKKMTADAAMMIQCGFLKRDEINTLREQTDDAALQAYLLQATKNNPETMLHI